MKRKGEGDPTAALAGGIRALRSAMEVVQRAASDGTNIATGGSIVMNDGEVWINGEKCYPKSLIKELAQAYDYLMIAAVAVGGPEDREAQPYYEECARRVERALKALDLA